MTLHRPTLYGPDGKPIVRVRDRSAPQAKGGASLDGWVSWGLIDRRGREVAGGEQHNLILDTFLDRIATNTASNGFASFDSFLSHFAVGTGSAAPDVTDTALDSELARTTTVITNKTTRVANGVYELVLEREFDFNEGNGNLTEFGFSYGASSDMLVRELFRDSNGDPTTVTKTSDYKLRIKYTLTVALTPVDLSTPASFTITGIGLINGAHTWNGFQNLNDLLVFARLAQGRVQSYPQGGNVVKPRLINAVLSGYSTDISNFSSGRGSTTDATDSYTPGSHKRAITSAFWGTAAGNASGIRTIAVGPTATGSGSGVDHSGWGFAIDEADAITKDNLHTLTINNLLTVSWGRAA